ncbi:hypothetical protein AX16_003024 [Volvariella volvacea WC 439]|nr:hypothetical protein AX16_003024 [Volvariella volvacea WC 439]
MPYLLIRDPEASLTTAYRLTEGYDIMTEIACYSLGFISHVLTYYTLLCFWYGRSPPWPFSPMTQSRFDVVLASLGLNVAGDTNSRCM